MITDLARTGAALVNSRTPVIFLDRKGRPQSWNQAAQDLLPALAKDSLGKSGKHFREAILAGASSEDAIRFDYLLSNNISDFVFDFSIPQNDETVYWYKLIVHRQEDGSYFSLINDITNQKLKETHLVQAKESAEKASVSRSQFLANISHEIRTPIQTIVGMMELLADTKLDEEQTEYARQVRFSADVMLALINDVLDFSKVEAGQLKIESIEYSLEDAMEQTVDVVSMEAHKKGLEISMDIDPRLPIMLIGDPIRLRQVILNLVKNAVKFTETGSILVRATLQVRDSSIPMRNPTANYIHFEVIDTGIGISKEVQGKLFSQFVQADTSTTRKFGGTGLGLAISRDIVELMDGEIGVTSDGKKGSNFWFDLPLIPAAMQPEPVQVNLDRKTRFLLVDDNRQTLEILSRMLVSLGYSQVTTATSGMFALAMLHSAKHAKRPFDIVLIDMVMPEMDGWRLAAEINKNREINQAQLYLMVPEGSFGADAKMKLLEWFNGYLYKPIKRRLLADLLKEHWQSSIDLEVVEELDSTELHEGELEELLPAQNEPKSAEHAEKSITSEIDESASANNSEPSVAPTLQASGLTILVAEDHPVNRKLLTIFLEKAGATVLQATDGKEATECISSTPVDLVFMDIQMPQMNGYEATSWMRDNGYKCPIIACTASAQENEREQCLSYGMTDILPKPYRRQDVMNIIQKYVKNTEEQHMNSPDTQVFDSTLFSEIMMGDIDSAKLLIGEYLEQTKSHISLLEEDINANSADATRKSAHLIKGSSLNVTAHRLAEAALSIEKGADNSSNEELKKALADLKIEFSRLEKALKTEGYLQ